MENYRLISFLWTFPVLKNLHYCVTTTGVPTDAQLKNQRA